MLICKPKSLADRSVKLENKLGLICGTSSCHMIVSEKPAYIPGVWGPYYSAMVPGEYSVTAQLFALYYSAEEIRSWMTHILATCTL